jgi:hypothetical protein
MEGVNDSMEDTSVMWSDSDDSEETEDKVVNEEELVESDTEGPEGAREPLPSTPDSAASRSSSSSSSSSSVAAAAASRYNTRGYGPAVHTRVCIALYSSSDERDLPQRQQEKLHINASMARTRKLKAKRPFFSDLIPLLVFLLLYLSKCPSGNKKRGALWMDQPLLPLFLSVRQTIISNSLLKPRKFDLKNPSPCIMFNLMALLSKWIAHFPPASISEYQEKSASM